MPTARELLDQADALMRRNRKRGRGPAGDVPTLTDSLDARDTALAPTVILVNAPAGADPFVLEQPGDADRAVDGVGAGTIDPMPLDTLGDVPVLTDAVLDWLPNQPPADEPRDVVAHAGDAFPASAAEAEVAAAELPPPAVLERESEADADADASVPDGGETPHPHPVAAHAEPRVPFLDDDFILEIPPPAEPVQVAAAPPAPAPATIGAETPATGSREWDALAEEIRIQVLQRLDLFTDTRLREQLGARLSPIVERASAQLIETINRELGELVRGYVAEAIEREIESWRKQNPASPQSTPGLATSTSGSEL
jgi:hypothetical protein